MRTTFAVALGVLAVAVTGGGLASAVSTLYLLNPAFCDGIIWNSAVGPSPESTSECSVGEGQTSASCSAVTAGADAYCIAPFNGYHAIRIMEMYYCDPACGETFSTNGANKNYLLHDAHDENNWIINFADGVALGGPGCTDFRDKGWHGTAVQGALTWDHGFFCPTGFAKGTYGAGVQYGS